MAVTLVWKMLLQTGGLRDAGKYCRAQAGSLWCQLFASMPASVLRDVVGHTGRDEAPDWPRWMHEKDVVIAGQLQLHLMCMLSCGVAAQKSVRKALCLNSLNSRIVSMSQSSPSVHVCAVRYLPGASR